MRRLITIAEALTVTLVNMKNIYEKYPVIAICITGIIVGLMVGGGVLTGFGNGLVAGAFGAIVISIILLIGGTITAGLAGFTTAAIASVTWIVYIFVTSGFVVGVGGAIGSLISGKN